MNIEKTECDRLGYEYKSLLEQVVYALHHIPYAKDFISEERLKKLNDLCLKLSTGDCEIIEFKRTLCKYDFTDILKEKDVEIDRLNNIIKELSKDVDMWNKKYNEQFDIITELEKWLEERTYGMNEIHTYKIGALEDEVILNKLKALKENNK